MRKLAMLMPGQGAQYVAMGRKLCETYPAAESVFEEAGETLSLDLKRLCFEGDLKELTKTENAQPAILTASVAAFRVYMDQFGIEPAVSAGHSLGEFSALTCAGAIDFADSVRIVRQRGLFMQEAVPHGVGAMVAVSDMDRVAVEEACAKISAEGHFVGVSNDNSPGQLVLSGHQAAVQAISEDLKTKGGRVIPLQVSSPFHSPLMQPVAERMREELGKYTFRRPKWDVLSNVSALPHEGAEQIAENLVNQIVQPVRWTECMAYLYAQGITHAVDVGPGHVLKNLMKNNIFSLPAYALDKEEDTAAFAEAMGVARKPVSGRPKVFLLARCLGIAVCTQNFNWDNEAYHKGVVEPYKRIQQLREQLELEGQEPTIDQMRDALLMLQSVFRTKGTPVSEQIDRYNALFEETGTSFADFEFPVS